MVHHEHPGRAARAVVRGLAGRLPPRPVPACEQLLVDHRVLTGAPVLGEAAHLGEQAPVVRGARWRRLERERRAPGQEAGVVEEVRRPAGTGGGAVAHGLGHHRPAPAVGGQTGGQAPRRQLHVGSGKGDPPAPGDAEPGIAGLARQRRLVQGDHGHPRGRGAHRLGDALAPTRDHDHLEGVVELLARGGGDGPEDAGLVVAADDHHRDRRLTRGQRLGVLHRLVGHRREERAARVPEPGAVGHVEQVVVRPLPLVVRVGLAVLGEPGPSPFGGERAAVLDAERGAPPPVPGDGGGDRHEVESVGREHVTGYRGEQPPHPQRLAGVVVEVADHAQDREEVGVVGIGTVGEEGPQGRGVVGGQELVGVERHHPRRGEVQRRGQETVAVGGVVPPGVALPPRVGEHRVHQGVGLEDRPGVVGAAVVERHNRVGEPGDGLQVTRQIGGGVAGRQQRHHGTGHDDRWYPEHALWRSGPGATTIAR